MPEPLVSKHWLVSGSGAATTQYATRAAANVEAQELAAANPGEVYTIYEAQAYTYTATTTVKINPVGAPVVEV